MSKRKAEEHKDKKRINFTQDELSKLLNCVLKHKDIIENKKTDAIMWEEKKHAWEIIGNEFNATAIYPRTLDSLKEKYKNIKKNIRKEAAMEKQEIYKTGGGEPHVVEKKI